MRIQSKIFEFTEAIIPLAAGLGKIFLEYNDLLHQQHILVEGFGSVDVLVGDDVVVLWIAGGSYLKISTGSELLNDRNLPYISPTAISSYTPNKTPMVYHSERILPMLLPDKGLPHPCPDEVYFQQSLLYDYFEPQQYQSTLLLMDSTLSDELTYSISLSSDGTKVNVPSVEVIDYILEQFVI